MSLLHTLMRYYIIRNTLLSKFLLTYSSIYIRYFLVHIFTQSNSKPNKCWAPGCKSNYYPNDAYTPVFKSPEDPEIRQSWLNALHREHVNPPNTFYVCIKHFLKQDIDYTFRINDGLEIKYLKRDRHLLVNVPGWCFEMTH